MTASLPLFDRMRPETSWREICPGAFLMQGFATAEASGLLAALPALAARSPFRHMVTARGRCMAVAMTNCGAVGWVSDRAGYRYLPEDPATGKAWPAMPPHFVELASRAALAAGYPAFVPDVCLINRYEPGNALSLHQDRDERSFAHPIVSVSLGASARFMFGGPARSDRVERLPLHHGDVVVWGGPARRYFHGIAALREGQQSPLGPLRINLTFRRAN